MVALLSLLLLVGPVTLARRASWWDELERPAWAPSARIAVGTGIGAAALEATAVWLVWSEHGWSLPIYLWVAHVAIAPTWWGLAVARGRLSAGFTMLCVDWTALAIAAAAFSAFTPVAGWVVAIALAWSTWMGASVFFLWQANQPSRP